MSTLRRLLGTMKPYMGRMILAATLLAVSGALMGAVVSTVKPLVNRVLVPGFTAESPEPDASSPAVGGDILDWLPRDRLAGWAAEHAFVQVPLLIVGLFFIKGVFQYFGQYFTIRTGAMVIRDLRAQLYRSVIYQSRAFFQVHATGVIVSRILNDVQQLQRISTTMLADLVRVGAMVPFLAITAVYHEWRMSLLAAVMLPVLGYPMVRLGRKLRRASTASQEHMGAMASRLTESITGVKVVQGFSNEEHEIGLFDRSVHAILRADLRAGRAKALSPAVMELVGAGVGAALFYLAGYFISRGRLDAGNFTVVLFCLGLLFISIRRLNAIYAEMQNALAAATRVFAMLDEDRRIADRADAAPLAPFSETIRFDRVGFSYGDAPVLQGIDLTIRRGETVALVGPSGSGKSTLADLLPRFYDPTEGRILVDGVDIRGVTLRSLRGQIGLVTQETVLFDDSVRDNIAYGLADVPDERVTGAARAAQAHAFIEELPRGYATMLGERGTRLSMGQRQRISIARALLKDPPLLILDEATSALDAQSEALVQEALERLMQGRTSLVIAHRLATVRNAHRILVMDAGRIVEEGTHDDLSRQGGVYARWCALQFREADG
jgi:subfamily B ATP-binding cassette protein MsbA